jgi:hypothetical protein
LVDVQVAVKPQYQRRALPGKQPPPPPAGQAPHPGRTAASRSPCPRLPATRTERRSWMNSRTSTAAGIGVKMGGHPDPAPAHIQLHQRGLHRVIAALPVTAQHTASRHSHSLAATYSLYSIPRAAHRPPPQITRSTLARGARRRIWLSPTALIRPRTAAQLPPRPGPANAPAG